MDTGTVCCLTHLEIVSTEKRTRVLCVHLCECVQVYARASVCVCVGGGGGGCVAARDLFPPIGRIAV